MVIKVVAFGDLIGSEVNDLLTFDNSNVYTSVIVIDGGAGDDTIRAGVGSGQYVGSVQIKGGDGNDLIETGTITGNISGQGYIDAGSGNDTIHVKDTGFGVGVFGTTPFNIGGGSGNDVFQLDATQLSTLGVAGPKIDGGSGFDTLKWNGRYNLTNGGGQAVGVGKLSGTTYDQQILVSNIEHLDIAATGATGLNIRLTSQDVAQITAGSDFNRADLGIAGLSGTGNTLYIELGQGNNIDLTGWAMVDPYVRLIGHDYSSYVSNNNYILLG